jgi:hypothetical protein
MKKIDRVKKQKETNQFKQTKETEGAGGSLLCQKLHFKADSLYK